FLDRCWQDSHVCLQDDDVPGGTIPERRNPAPGGVSRRGGGAPTAFPQGRPDRLEPGPRGRGPEPPPRPPPTIGRFRRRRTRASLSDSIGGRGRSRPEALARSLETTVADARPAGAGTSPRTGTPARADRPGTGAQADTQTVQDP